MIKELRRNTCETIESKGLAAVKFAQRDSTLGMEILLEDGKVQMFPNSVFICTIEQVVSSLPIF